MIYAHRTDTGLRKSNQDCFYTPEEGAKPIVVVADGMGGHKAGSVASVLAIDSIKNFIESIERAESKQLLLQHAINYANRRIYEISTRDEDCEGMGTTVVMAYVDENKFYYANVGDSRLYHFDGETLTKITQDHSYVEELVAMGEITREQADEHPLRNILTRAVGLTPFVKADTASRPWKKGDILLLCSDGLHGSVSIEAIKNALMEGTDLFDSCDMLTELAIWNGSTDNITIVLVKNDGNGGGEEL